MSSISSSNSKTSNPNSIHSSENSSVPSSNTQRINPQPRYIKDPTTLETISTALTGFTSYVRKTIPDGLLNKALNLSPKLVHSNQYSNSPSPINGLPSSPSDLKDNRIPSHLTGLKQRPVKITSISFDFLRFYPNFNKKLCLLLGYSDGFQVWDVDDIGKINEVALVKLDYGEINSLKALHPDEDNADLRIIFSATRSMSHYPVHLNDPQKNEEISTVGLYSLTENRLVSKVIYESEKVTSVDCCELCIVVATTLPSIRLLSKKDLSEDYQFSDVLVNPISKSPVFTLGSRWIAYSTTLETPWMADSTSLPDIRAKVAKVDRVAKDMVKGLKSFGVSGYQKINTYLTSSSPDNISGARRNTICEGLQMNSNSSSPKTVGRNDFPKDSGRVVVRDLSSFLHSEAKHPLSPKFNGEVDTALPSIAHFHCHYYPIANLAFNKSGNLLATTSVEGHSFYIYEILGPSHYQAPYRYKLTRGLTDAAVVNMAFNNDSRWFSTTTNHGTTHLFLINPYGGAPHIESHLNNKIVNVPSYFPHPKNVNDSFIKPVSLSPTARFRRRTGVDGSLEEMNEVEPSFGSFPPNPKANSVSRKNYLMDVYFMSQSSSLKRWLDKLPSAYEQQDTNELGPQISNAVLSADSDGNLTLHRILVSGKLTKQSVTTGNTAEEIYLSSKVERIAEWSLIKNPNDFERFIDMSTLQSSFNKPSNDERPYWEPESKWLPYVETRSYDTYACPSRPLWTLSQFEFKIYCSSDDKTDMEKTENLDVELFDRSALKTKLLSVRQQKLPRPYGRDEIAYQAEVSGGIDDLMHAMESTLDKPSQPAKVVQDAISFESAYEIHLVQPRNTDINDSVKNQLRGVKIPVTEIPPNFVAEALEKQNKANSKQPPQSSSQLPPLPTQPERTESYEQVEIFAMDEDEDAFNLSDQFDQQCFLKDHVNPLPQLEIDSPPPKSASDTAEEASPVEEHLSGIIDFTIESSKAEESYDFQHTEFNDIDTEAQEEIEEEEEFDVTSEHQFDFLPTQPTSTKSLNDVDDGDDGEFEDHNDIQFDLDNFLNLANSHSKEDYF